MFDYDQDSGEDHQDSATIVTDEDEPAEKKEYYLEELE